MFRVEMVTILITMEHALEIPSIAYMLINMDSAWIVTPTTYLSMGFAVLKYNSAKDMEVWMVGQSVSNVQMDIIPKTHSHASFYLKIVLPQTLMVNVHNAAITTN